MPKSRKKPNLTTCLTYSLLLSFSVWQGAYADTPSELKTFEDSKSETDLTAPGSLGHPDTTQADASKAPDDVQAMLKSASSKFGNGDVAGATQDLDDAIKKYPKSFQAYNMRSKIKFSQKQFAESIADCDESLKIKPNTVAFVDRSAAKMELNDVTGALADAESALAAAGSPMATANALFARGQVNQKQGKYQESIADFDAAIAINSKVARFYFQKGFAEIKLNQLDKARKDTETAVDMNPKLAAAHTNLAYLKMKSKDFEGALKEADQVVLLKPEKADSYEERGKTKLNIGDYTGALDDLKKAAELGGTTDENTDLQNKTTALIQKESKLPFPSKPNDSRAPETKLTPEQDKATTTYVQSVERAVKQYWAPAKSDVSKETSIRFMVDQNGKLFDIAIHKSSGDTKYDESVKAAVEKAGNVPKPPAFLKPPVYLDVHFDMRVTTK